MNCRLLFYADMLAQWVRANGKGEKKWDLVEPELGVMRVLAKDLYMKAYVGDCGGVLVVSYGI